MAVEMHGFLPKKENFFLSCTGEYFVSNSKRQERELEQPPMGAVNTSVTAELHCFCWKLPAMQRPVGLLKVTSVFVNMHSARGASLAVTNCSAATGAYKGCLWFPLSGLCHKMLNTRSVCRIETLWLLFRSTKLGEKFGRAEAKVPSHLSKTHWIPLSSFENPFYPMKIQPGCMSPIPPSEIFTSSLLGEAILHISWHPRVWGTARHFYIQTMLLRWEMSLPQPAQSRGAAALTQCQALPSDSSRASRHHSLAAHSRETQEEEGMRSHTPSWAWGRRPNSDDLESWLSLNQPCLDF